MSSLSIGNIYLFNLQKEDSPLNSGLEEPHLLAFIIYKNCYLDDSVKIHDGKSKLDSFYNHARELTKQKLPDLINQTHKLEDQISKFTDESCAEKHALEL